MREIRDDFRPSGDIRIMTTEVPAECLELTNQTTAEPLIGKLKSVHDTRLIQGLPVGDLR